MRRADSILALILLVIMAACTTVSPAASPAAPSSPPTATPAPASPSAEPSAMPTSEPIPSDDLGPFTCALPIVEAATVAETANYTDVRVGEHDGYDRFVIEFEQGTPEFTLDRAQPPYVQEGSGFELEVDGGSVLRLTLRGGTAMTESGESSYDGPREFRADLPQLVHVVHGGDFEAQTTWYLGLSSEACVRVLLLDAPPRLVIDLEH